MLFFHPIFTNNTEVSSMSSRLDRVDLQMLRLLQNNGRLSNAELAEMVGVSAATCHRRTQRLFDEGFVPEVRAVVRRARSVRGRLSWSAWCSTAPRPKALPLSSRRSQS